MPTCTEVKKVSLVHQLQADALNGQVKLTDLLRKAKTVATKLKLAEFRAWCDHELNGYPPDAVPDYRHVSGELKAKNPVTHIWMPCYFEDSALAEQLSHRAVQSSVAELEHLASGDGMLAMPFNQEAQMHFMRYSNVPAPPFLVIQRNRIIGILDTVRTTILEWSLKLEEDGIVGEGMSFSNEEQAVASSKMADLLPPGSVIINSVIQHNSPSATQSLRP